MFKLGCETHVKHHFWTVGTLRFNGGRRHSSIDLWAPRWRQSAMYIWHICDTHVFLSARYRHWDAWACQTEAPLCGWCRTVQLGVFWVIQTLRAQLRRLTRMQLCRIHCVPEQCVFMKWIAMTTYVPLAWDSFYICWTLCHIIVIRACMNSVALLHNNDCACF